MLFKRDLEGKEIIDKDGNTIGLIEDLDITEKGHVQRVVAIPTGIVNRITRKKMEIHIDDIETISKLVLLKKTEEELKGIYRCRKCGKTFKTEQGRKVHYAREHAKKKTCSKRSPSQSKRQKKN